MNRAEILDAAKGFVTDDRNTSYGEPENSFQTIAVLWREYLLARPDPQTAITAYDVGCMMVLLKIARAAQRPTSLDSLIDAAGYAACAGEILKK